jgi:hypothetical protein
LRPALRFHLGLEGPQQSAGKIKKRFPGLWATAILMNCFAITGRLGLFKIPVTITQ